MNGERFDALAARLGSSASRRVAMRSLAGGAIAVVGAASAAAVEGKGKQVSSEHNVVGNRKRVFCFCPSDGQAPCETRRVKTKKFRKLFRKNPNSYRGPCQLQLP